MTDPAAACGGRSSALPCDLFTPDLFKQRSWEDSALPIACGQTISQPFIVGLMTQALTLEPRARVLEIGTGSGYQTAVLSRLARLVYTVERYRTLKKEAEARFEALQLTNVITKFGDGGLGWPEQAPFDRILVTAASGTSEAKTLLRQSRACRCPGRADRQGPGAEADALRRRRRGGVSGRSPLRGALRASARRGGARTLMVAVPEEKNCSSKQA